MHGQKIFKTLDLWFINTWNNINQLQRNGSCIRMSEGCIWFKRIRAQILLKGRKPISCVVITKIWTLVDWMSNKWQIILIVHVFAHIYIYMGYLYLSLRAERVSQPAGRGWIYATHRSQSVGAKKIKKIPPKQSWNKLTKIPLLYDDGDF